MFSHACDTSLDSKDGPTRLNRSVQRFDFTWIAILHSNFLYSIISTTRASILFGHTAGSLFIFSKYWLDSVSQSSRSCLPRTGGLLYVCFATLGGSLANACIDEVVDNLIIEYIKVLRLMYKANINFSSCNKHWFKTKFFPTTNGQSKWYQDKPMDKSLHFTQPLNIMVSNLMPEKRYGRN